MGRNTLIVTLLLFLLTPCVISGAGISEEVPKPKPYKFTGSAVGEGFIKPDKEKLNASLTDLQYCVTQENSTEQPFSNEYWNNKKAGIYVDIISSEPLFCSTDKYQSGSGWPSFTRPLIEQNIVELEDTSYGMICREVRSANADSHLGHLFTDGPVEEGGLRYCINSASLRFIPKEEMAAEGYEEFLFLFDREE